MKEADKTEAELPVLLLGQAVLGLAQSVDMEGLLRHESAAIAQLDQSLSKMVTLIGTGKLQEIAALRHEKTAPDEPASTPSPVKPNNPPTTGGSLTKVLGNIGLAQHLGHVFITKRKPNLQPLKNIPDITGLPMFQACIAPSWSPIDGAHGIFITGSAVMTAVYPLPFETNRWHVRESHTYDNRDEMLEIVRELMAPH